MEEPKKKVRADPDRIPPKDKPSTTDEKNKEKLTSAAEFLALATSRTEVPNLSNSRGQRD